MDLPLDGGELLVERHLLLALLQLLVQQLVAVALRLESGVCAASENCAELRQICAKNCARLQLEVAAQLLDLLVADAHLLLDVDEALDLDLLLDLDHALHQHLLLDEHL